MEEVDIFNIKINPVKRSDLVALIKSNLEKGIQTTQFGVNSATINELIENEEYRHALNDADLLNIDGMSVVWGLRYLGFKVPERVATPDLADDIIALAEKQEFRIFLLGARESILTLCVNNLKKSFPRLLIAGSHDGYFMQDNELEIVDLIKKAKPDILLIGMPSPRKELFCQSFKKKLDVKYILGVGGYFDIISGRIRRAPKWMQNIGLEWTYRLLQEPERMWRRYLIGTNKFFWAIIKEKKAMRRTTNK